MTHNIPQQKNTNKTLLNGVEWILVTNIFSSSIHSTLLPWSWLLLTSKFWECSIFLQDLLDILPLALTIEVPTNNNISLYIPMIINIFLLSKNTLALCVCIIIDKLHTHTVGFEPTNFPSTHFMGEESAIWARAHWPLALYISIQSHPCFMTMMSL